MTHMHTSGGSVCRWPCTSSCTGVLLCVAQSTSVHNMTYAGFDSFRMVTSMLA